MCSLGPRSPLKRCVIHHLVFHLLHVDSGLDINPDDSASAAGDAPAGSTLSLYSSCSKKLQTAAALAVEREAQLDGTKNMQEGKQGCTRHVVSVALGLLEKDEQKRALPETINLKNAYNLYLKTDLLCPENIHDVQTSKIPVLITEVSTKWTVPSNPIKVYIGRLAAAASQSAYQSREKNRAHIDIVYPYMTARLAERGFTEWDVHAAVFTALAPIKIMEKWEIFEGQYLHKYFIPVISSQEQSIVCMVSNNW